MHNKNKMKVSELQEIIRKVIKDTINEADLSPADKTAKDAEMKAIDAKIKALNAKKTDLASGREDITEDNVSELANVAVRYELAPDVNAADFAGKKNRIITAMKATEEPMSKIDVAGELGYDKQNPINKDFMELVADGTIVQSGGQAAPRLNRPAGEPAATAAADDEFDFIKGDMSDEEIDASFAKAAAAGDEEPEIGDVERTSSSAPKLTDDEYEAFMKAIDLERRLAATKSNILKLRKGRSTAGDISDKPSSELQRLRDLKASLEKRLADLESTSAYLSQRSKLSGKTPEEPKIDDVEDEEPIDEWAVSRAQYYAGIKK